MPGREAPATSSLEQDFSTDWAESTRSVSDSFSYSYSDSGSSQGGDSYGPVQWSLTGSKEQTVSQSWTASLSSSKSTQYTTTMPGGIDPETGLDIAMTLTHTSLSTRTSTYSEDVHDEVSGNFGAETQTRTTKSGSTSDTNDEAHSYFGHDVRTTESESSSSQTMTYSNASQSGSVNGGSSTSWTTTINGTATHGPATQAPPYSYTLSNNYSPSDSGAASEPSGGGGVPWLERLGLGTDPAAAFAFGLLQGATNIVNGVTQMVGGGDWSRGAFVYESDGAHSLSKNLGGQGAAILLMGGLGQTTIVAKLGCILNNPVVKGVGIVDGMMAAGSELGEFAQAVSNGDGYGAVEHGGLALMGLLDVASAFGQACFAAGTPIVTRDGSKSIEEIRPGDYVLASPEDDPDAAPSFRLVEEVFQTFSPLMEVRVKSRTILTTAERPFWVQGRGWTEAQQLKAGDQLRTDDGRWVQIEEVGRPCDPAPVYNMRVADYHTYFVGCEEWAFTVWAHNTSCGERTVRRARHADLLEQQGMRVINGKPSGTRNPAVEEAIGKGNTAHAVIQEQMRTKGWKVDRTDTGKVDPSTGTTVYPDAISPAGHPVEIKPRTPTGIVKGQSQIALYEWITGRVGRVIYYDPSEF